MFKFRQLALFGIVLLAQPFSLVVAADDNDLARAGQILSEPEIFTHGQGTLDGIIKYLEKIRRSEDAALLTKLRTNNMAAFGRMYREALVAARAAASAPSASAHPAAAGGAAAAPGRPAASAAAGAGAASAPSASAHPAAAAAAPRHRSPSRSGSAAAAAGAAVSGHRSPARSGSVAAGSAGAGAAVGFCGKPCAGVLPYGSGACLACLEIYQGSGTK